jgi:hypothetical protein
VVNIVDMRMPQAHVQIASINEWQARPAGARTSRNADRLPRGLTTE